MAVSICPICNGQGQIPDPITKDSTLPTIKTCHGCNGKGWIETRDPRPAVPYPHDSHRRPYLYPFWPWYYSG